MATARQRRAAERRRLQRQALRRNEAVARRRRTNLVISVVGAVVVIGVVIGIIAATTGSGSSSAAASSGKTNASVEPTSATRSAPSTSSTAGSTTTSGTPSTSADSSSPSGRRSTPPVARTTCAYRPAGSTARNVTRPPTRAVASGTALVRITTSQGTLQFTLNRSAAPCTVNSFVSLARQKFYNGTPCHRLVTRNIFVVQCGDPTGTGAGGPGYAFNDELKGRETYTRGVLAMANGGPNTDGSQFFMVYRKSALGPQFTVFGTVSAGLGVLDRVARAGTKDRSSDGPPRLPLTLRSVAVG